MSLRSQVIRLAHERPELREDLLPLVASSGVPDDWEAYWREVHEDEDPDFASTMREFPAWSIKGDRTGDVVRQDGAYVALIGAHGRWAVFNPKGKRFRARARFKTPSVAIRAVEEMYPSR